MGRTSTRWASFTGGTWHEPAVPRCGLMFPDGTPVSVAEAAALRGWSRHLDGTPDTQPDAVLLDARVAIVEDELVPGALMQVPPRRRETG